MSLTENEIAAIANAQLNDDQMQTLKGYGIATEVDGVTHYHFSGVTFFAPKIKKEKNQVRVMKKKKREFVISPKLLDDWSCLDDFNVEYEYNYEDKEICVVPIFRRKRNIEYEFVPRETLERAYEVVLKTAHLLAKASSSYELAIQCARNRQMHSLNGNIDSCSEHHVLSSHFPIYSSTAVITYHFRVLYRSIDFFYADSFKIINCGKCHRLYEFVFLTAPHAARENMDWLTRFLQLNMISTHYSIAINYLNTPEKHILHKQHIKDVRTNKEIKHMADQRLQRLISSDNKFAKDLKFDHIKFIKERRQRKALEITFKQLFPQKHFFSVNVPVKLGMPDVLAQVQEVIDNFPEEYRSFFNWTEIMASFYTLINNKDFVSQYLAITILYREFKVQGVALAVFVGTCAKILQYFKFLNIPTKHQEEYTIAYNHFAQDERNPIKVLITLILTILFQRNVGTNVVDSCIRNCIDLGRKTDGIDVVLTAVKGCVNYVRNVSSDESSFESQIDKIEERVKFYLTPEGSHAIDFEQGSFTEIALMNVNCVDLVKYVPRHTVNFVRLSNLAYKVNNLYRRAQTTPASGHAYRKRPVVLHLHGNPGVGKTHMVNLFAADLLPLILQLGGTPDDQLKEEARNYSKYVYYRPVGMKYETGYNTEFSKIYVCDDANQINPNFKTDDTPFPVGLIHWNNSHDHTVNVAEVENKMRAKFNSSLIIATDNEETPDLSYLQSTDAYWRRIDFSYKVKVDPKKTMNTPVTKFKSISVLDPSKCEGPSDLSVYRFHDTKSRKILTYEQVLEELSTKLKEVNENYFVSAASFKEHAERSAQRLLDVRIENRADIINNELPANHVNGFFRQLENVNRGPPVTFYQKFLTLVSLFLVKTRLYKITNKFNKQNNRNILLFVGSIGLISAAAYGLYKLWQRGNKRYFSPTNKCTTPKNQDNDDDATQEKYNPGDATKGKPRPKEVPSAPIVTQPLFPQKQNSHERKEIHDAREFADIQVPNKELDGWRSYVKARQLCSNMYLVQLVTPEGSARTLRLVFIRGTLAIVNRHLVADMTYEQYKECYYNIFGVFTSKRKIPAEKVSVTTFHHANDSNHYYDVICLDFGREVNSHTDVTTFTNEHSNFIKSSEIADIKGNEVMVLTLQLNFQMLEKDMEEYFTGKEAWYVEMQHTKILEVRTEPLETANADGTRDYTYNTMEYKMKSIPGYCGSVVIKSVGGDSGMIFGIHMAGYCALDRSYGQIVTEEMIKSLDVSKHSLYFKDFERQPHTVLTSEFQRITTIPQSIYANNKSRIRKSLLHNKVYETTKKPAYLGFVPHLNEHVINIALRKYITPSVGCNVDQRAIVLGFLKHNFKPEGQCKKLSHEVSIRGIEGDDWIKPINRSSSAGWPFVHFTKKKGKKEFLGVDDDWIYDHPLVIKLLDDYKDKTLRNERPACYFTATSKDELRPIEKVEKGKTRSFAAAPLHYVILFRQYYLDLFAHIMRHRIYNSSLVGVNPYSDEWDVVKMVLCSVASPDSKQFIAGDYTNYDGTLNTDVLWVIHEFIESCYNRDDDEKKISQMLWMELVSSRHISGNVVIQMPRGMPSGNPGTAIINTLFGSAIVYLALFEILDDIGTLEAFNIQENLTDHYKGIFYGDDNIISFSDKLSSLIQPTDLQNQLSKYGLIYTTELKDDTAFTYRNLHEISILKRKFLFDKTQRAWLAPLELASIMEPLNWDKCNANNITECEDQMKMNARLAIRELSLHPESVFDEWSRKIIEVCEDNQLILVPDCYFTQKVLRRMVRKSDQLFYFGDIDEEEDYEQNGEPELQPQIWKNDGMHIYAGSRHSGSPTEELQQTTMFQFCPTKHMYSRTATTEGKNMVAAYSQETEEVGEIPFTDTTSEVVTTGKEIIAFSTVEAPVVDTVPAHQELPGELKGNFSESREHDIQSILCREYLFDQFSIPVGGLTGDVIKSWNVLELLISQTNVLEKVKGFAYLRGEIFVRLEFAVQPFVSGGLILSYYPDVSDETRQSRQADILQLSQTPNVQMSLPSSQTLQVRVPFISPWTARNLQTGTGSIGNVTLSRITPSAILSVNVSAYISGYMMNVSYPTYADTFLAATTIQEQIDRLKAQLEVANARDFGPLPREVVQLRNMPVKHVLQTEATRMRKEGVVSGLINQVGNVATAASGLPIVGSVASAAAPILKMGSKLLGAFGLSKPQSEDTIKAIKWKPGDHHLTSQGVIPGHVLSVDQGQAVTMKPGEFGSEIDEMSVEAICRAPAILSVFAWSTSNVAGTVLYNAPCCISQAKSAGSNVVYLTHQAWVAQLCQLWLADLIFDLDVYGTQFHKGKLRFIFTPNDYAGVAQFSVVSKEQRNLSLSAVVEFGGDNVNKSIRIEPAANTNMKCVPSTWVGNQSRLGDWFDNMHTEQCSYGTFMVVVEVPLVAASSVSNTIHCALSFSAENVQLAFPAPNLAFLPRAVPTFEDEVVPQKHVLSTLGTDFLKFTRSERIETGATLVKGNSANINAEENMATCVGERVLSLRNLLNAYTYFARINVGLIGSNGLIVIVPLAYRKSSSGAFISDHLDYCAAGYAFFKGGVNIRIVGANGGSCAGQISLMSDLNPTMGSMFSTTLGAGWRVLTKSESSGEYQVTPGTRAIPVFDLENAVDINVPYLQPLHMTRIDAQGDDPYLGGKPLQLVLFKPNLGIQPNIDVYRMARDDYRLGFLTSLPVFLLNTNALYR